MLHTSVVIVRPGGTGRPALVISARPDPLPPSRSFIVRSPSALPSPKKYTYFLALTDLLAGPDCFVFAALCVLTEAFFEVFFKVAARFFDIYDSVGRI